MKQFNFKKLLFVVFAALISNFGFSQEGASFWSLSEKETTSPQEVIFTKAIPEISSFLKLDLQGLKVSLENIPKRGLTKKANTILGFPNAKGDIELYKVMEASVMTAELQSQFPMTRSFVGQGIDNPSAMLRFSLSEEKGLSSMVLSDKKTVFIEPYSKNLGTYISYVNSASDPVEDDFKCHTESLMSESTISDEEYNTLKNADDGQLRTYRLALACTVEYSQFHGGTLPDVIAAMNTTMTRVNGIYERDLGLTMVMVRNESIIFLGPDTNSDPYTNNNGPAMLGQNQQVCDANIGPANYDIGHVFSTGGGGIARLRSPCTNDKAQGVTGLPSPTGDKFDVDYVAHEMGHQYGGNHTQNNNCQRSGVSVEPGSASTIMGYAGICAPNVQNNSDDYFNGDNLKEMWVNISQGNSSNCGEKTPSGNVAPEVDAGPNYFIPKSTAFILKGFAIDEDTDDVLTYTWEQSDAIPAPMPPQSTSTVGPAFRSLSPTTSPDRFMPNFSTVLSGSLSSTWEVVPSVARTMSFLLTVRDNSILGGNSSSDQVVITVVETSPFEVQTPPTWAPGSTQTVNWTVGETNIAPINCETVNIYFSEDGVDFSTLLAEEVPNSGSAEITLPNIANTTEARILVEAVDHIFYSVSDAFNVDTTADFNINAINGDQSICNFDFASFEFEFITSNGFSETTTFTASGPNQAIYNFTPGSLNADGTFTLEVSNLLELNPANYTIDVIATSASITNSVSVNLNILNGACVSVANTAYDTSTTGVIINDGETDILSNLNTGKPSGYSDFTDIITDLNINSDYELTVNANSDGNFQIITYVWIDWNQNCSFDDAGEQYDLGLSANLFNQPTSGSPLSFTVPSNAVLGNTTMRVTTKYTPTGANDFPLPCENGHDAEVEDYTINVKTTLNQDSFALEDFSVYPNPSQGEFTIQFGTATSTAVQLKVFDIRGRTLVQKNYETSGQFNQTLDLQNLASGVYLLEVGDGSRSMTKKIIIE